MAGVLIFDVVDSASWADIAQAPMAIAALELASIILMGIGLFFTPANAYFPFPCAGLAVVGAMCYIVAGTSPHALFNSCLSTAVPVYVGKLSYSIYLWHWPVIVLLPWALAEKISSILHVGVCLGI